jgi:nitrogen fixation-related uncharacterized protein
MANRSTYSHADIQRYLQQKMSQQEMHAFEKAMMDDPFLADALEGFAVSNAELTEAHLSAIERKIKKEDDEMAVVPLPVQRTSWWKVAAIIIVIITGGVVSWSLLNQQYADRAGVQELAVNKQSEPVTQNDSVKAADATLAQPETQAQTELFKNKAAASSPMLQPKKSAAPEATASGNMLNEIQAETADEMLLKEKEELAASSTTLKQKRDYRHEDKAATNATFSPNSNNEATKKISGTVINQSGATIAGATVYDDKNKIETATDNAGKFSFKTTDSVIDIKASSMGYDVAKASAKSNNPDNRIVLEQSNKQLSEVVVTRTKAAGPKDLTTAQTTITQQLVPRNGWSYFNEYVAKQVDSTRAANNSAKLNTNVEVEFSIDKNGHPVKIRALNAPNNMIKAQAENIIKNGPLWTPFKNKRKVKVVVPF